MSRPDLYRSGNASSARFDNVRPSKDIPVRDGKVKPNEGGVSTNSVISPEWPDNKVWKLEAAARLSPLQARNDRGTHWSIEPKEEMPYNTYKEKLQGLNAVAVRVPPPPTANAGKTSVKDPSWARLGKRSPDQPTVPQGPSRQPDSRQPGPSRQTMASQGPSRQPDPSRRTTPSQGPSRQLQGPQAVTSAHAKASVATPSPAPKGSKKLKRT